ncbi:MAG TPA: GGDEF domain-containing protein [Pseudomonadales bacterium]|nr:GGDEF domain-containing protein [Pseudomonadales bacterium]
MSDNTQYRTPQDSGPEENAEEEKRPCLIMIKGDFIGQVYELTNDVIMLGRSDDVDLVISDISISRRHAMIVNRVDGFHVSDLGSTNGTFVNREPVHSPHVLNEGDKLTLGMVTFKFSYQDEDDTEYHLMLRNMAIKDGLTRVYNKRYFVEALEKEFDYNRRNHAGLALVLFDIDHFKQVNDTWGHPAGDFILKYMAQLIENEARGYDIFARYGGEEFVFLMRGSTRASAESLAERVRSLVEKHVFTYDEVDLKVTVSLGVAFWSGDDSVSDPEELVELADKLLYEAKRSGRNCIRSAATGTATDDGESQASKPG